MDKDSTDKHTEPVVNESGNQGQVTASPKKEGPGKRIEAEINSKAPVKRDWGLTLALDYRHIIWGLILLATIYTRFHHLGEKPFHHDESLYSKYMWNFYVGLGYEYDPMQHGPFMFFFAQLMFFLFGISNYTVRLQPALMGVGMVLLARAFRHRLGEWGAIILGIMLVISPHTMYFTRFMREDPMFAFGAVALVAGYSMYMYTKRAAYAYWAAAALAMIFCIKESYFVNVLTLLTFGVLVFIYEVYEGRKAGRALKAEALAVAARYPLLTKQFIITTIWGFVLTIYAGMHVAWRTTYKGNWDLMIRIYWVVGFLLMAGFIAYCLVMAERSRGRGAQGASLYKGFFDDSTTFAWSVGIFAAIWFVLYTTVGFNLPGFWKAIYGWFEYWLNQHQIKRIAGPFHYYNYKLINYEILAVAAALLYTVWKLMARLSFVIAAVVFMAVMVLIGDRGLPGINHEYFMGKDLVFALGFFIAGVWSVFQHLKEKKYFIAFTIHWAVMSYLAYSYLQEKVPWLGLHITIPTIFVAAYALMQLIKYNKSRPWKIVGLVLVGLLAAYEIHSSFLLNWFYESDPREQLVYVQTTPDMPRLVKEIEEIAEWRGEGKDMPLIYGGEATWPLYWYLRDWRKVLYMANIQENKEVPVIVADWKKRHEYAKALGDEYVVRRYRIRHWWIPSRNDFDKDFRVALKQFWRWVMYRETFKNEIYGSEDSAVFFHKDVAARLWNVDIGQPPPEAAVTERPVEPSLRSEVLPPLVMFGRYGNQTSSFNNPGDLAVDNEGNIWVVDTENSRVQKFAPDGAHLLTLGNQAGAEKGQFSKPRGIAIDNAGFVYVADTWNHRIQKFSLAGEFIMTWGSPEVYWAPKDLVVTDNNEVFIVDTGFHRVHKTDTTGREIKIFGQAGALSDQFQEPVGITTNIDGTVLICDTANHRVQVVDQNGQFVRRFFTYGWESYYSEPYIAVAPDGRIFVSDSPNHRIQIFSKEGTLLSYWGEKGVGKGQFMGPLGICIKGDKVYVSEGQNHRVQVFQIPGLQAEPAQQ